MNPRIAPFRNFIKQCYGLDAMNSTVNVSDGGMTLLWADAPYALRIFLALPGSRAQVASGALWTDDLKLFIKTVCEPIPSKNGRLVEMVTVNGFDYWIRAYYRPSGDMKAKVDSTYFMIVGDTLGRIHKAGQNALKTGFNYKLPKWRDKSEYLTKGIALNLPARALGRISTAYERVCAAPEDAAFYGILHGSFDCGNFFTDYNNIWVFDFDKCCYGYFMYDIASVMLSWMTLMRTGEPRQKLLGQKILPFFKLGYGMHVKLPQGQWNNLRSFMLLKQYEIATASKFAAGAYATPGDTVADKVRKMPLLADNIFIGLDDMAKYISDLYDSQQP